MADEYNRLSSSNDERVQGKTVADAIVPAPQRPAEDEARRPASRPGDLADIRLSSRSTAHPEAAQQGPLRANDVLPEDRNARTWNAACMPLRHSGSPTRARTEPPEVSSEWASSHLNASLDVRSHPYSPVSSETVYSVLFAWTSNPNTGSSPHTNASRILPVLRSLALPAHG